MSARGRVCGPPAWPVSHSESHTVGTGVYLIPTTTVQLQFHTGKRQGKVKVIVEI